MSWTSKKAEGENAGGKFEIPPAGTHLASLVAIIDLGTHDRENDKGVHVPRQEVLLVWELAYEVEAGTTNRHLIAKRYNFSSNPKSYLRIMLETWRGKKYAEGEEMDVAKSLGRPCFVSVTHKTTGQGREVADLSSVSMVPKGTAAVLPQQTPVIRQCTSPDPLPHWLPRVYGEEVAEIIKRSHECRPSRDNDAAPAHESGGAARQTAMAGTNSDDIPF